MTSILYSTECYIKNDLYRFGISVNNNNNNLTNSQSISNSFEFISPDIPIDEIVPSLTNFTFELLKGKSSVNVPKEIALNHILNVEEIKVTINRSRRKLYDSNIFVSTSDTQTPTSEQSRNSSRTTLNTVISDDNSIQSGSSNRRFSLSRLFSTQSFKIDDGRMPTTRIQINYVDVSNYVQWSLKRILLEVENDDVANELYINLNLCLSTLKERPRRLLAFANPFGGKGQAKSIYEKKVKPIFKKANINVNLIYTERANHAQEYIIKEDLDLYDGLICIGGDGMFAELCHGLLLRTALEANLDINDPKVNLVRPKLRIGIIPAGSTDSAVFCTTGLNDPKTSALQIILGESLSIDVATIHDENGFSRFMTIMLAYGFFGDIISQSDKWRCLGPLRYDLAGFCHFIRHKSYHTELTITLPTSESSKECHQENETLMNHPNGIANDITEGNPQQLSNVLDEEIAIKKTCRDVSFKIKQKNSSGCFLFCKRNCETCSIEDTIDYNRSNEPLKLEGRYTTINCLNMPGRCAKSKFGMSPYTHLGDGTCDLVLVKSSWRTSFLRFLWQVANDGRSIESLPNVETYRASEVIIRPKEMNAKHIGNWACDGELMSANLIKIRTHRQVLNLFASGIQSNQILNSKPKPERRNKICPFFGSRKRNDD